MKAAIDADKIGRPVLGTFSMFSWREGRIVVEMFTAIYRSNELQRPVKFPLTA